MTSGWVADLISQFQRQPWWRRWVRLSWRRISLMDRWLLGELIGPLLFALAAFTVVSLSVGVMFDLVRKIVESGLPFL
ncbi:MAG: permease, partial [Prochlorococcus sp.]